MSQPSLFGSPGGPWQAEIWSPVGCGWLPFERLHGPSWAATDDPASLFARAVAWRDVLDPFIRIIDVASGETVFASHGPRPERGYRGGVDERPEAGWTPGGKPPPTRP